MDKMKNLRLYNFVMGIFHLIQGVLMFVLSNDFKVPIQTSYVEYNEALQILEPIRDTVAHLRLGPLVALFLLLSAGAHFLLSLPSVYAWYKANLKKGINYARWWEYSLSSSIMIVIIAMLTGVYDMSTLILLFTLNAMMIFFGLIMELHNQTTEKTNWLSYIFGCIAGAVPWVVIFLHLLNAGEDENKAPDFVYYIFISIFLFFNVFALNMYMQYKKIGKWKEYTFGEKMYILLSLLAKSALAWQVFAGTLRPM